MVTQNGYPDLIKTLTVQGWKGSLQCAHINVNGLYNKIEEVRILLEETKFNLLAITESHLDKDLHNDTEIRIDEYSFLRKDRSGEKNHWGGVLVYYRINLELHQMKIKTDLESVWLEIIMIPKTACWLHLPPTK